MSFSDKLNQLKKQLLDPLKPEQNEQLVEISSESEESSDDGIIVITDASQAQTEKEPLLNLDENANVINFKDLPVPPVLRLTMKRCFLWMTSFFMKIMLFLYLLLLFGFVTLKTVKFNNFW